ncbi:MAG: PEP-CTERM sorting domain-containing protein [Planctomycetota bacterium]
MTIYKTTTHSFLFGILVCLLAPAADGGLLIRFESTPIVEGRSGLVDVFVSGDSSDLITDASFEFRITPLGGTPRQLSFADPQSDSQLSDPDYLFQAASFRRDGDPLLGVAPSAVGSVSSVDRLNDTYIGLDSDPTLAGVVIGTDELLLARLDLTSGPGLLAPIAGDQFQLELVASPNTFFFDPSNPNLFADWNSTPTTLTVTAIPEPSSFAMTGLVVLIAGIRRHSRRADRK